MPNRRYNKQVPGFKSGGRVGLKDGSLKPVDKSKNPGLAKLPTKVRNKMGYKKKGGKLKKMMGGGTMGRTMMKPNMMYKKGGKGKK